MITINANIKKKRDPLITWLRRLLCSATLNGSTPHEERRSYCAQWMGNNNDYLARVSPHQLALLLSKEEMDHVVSSLLKSTAFHREQSFVILNFLDSFFLFKKRRFPTGLLVIFTQKVFQNHSKSLIWQHLRVLLNSFGNFQTLCHVSLRLRTLSV